MNRGAPRITVIMRTKNSDWVVGQTLAALFSQTVTDFELLVVDSGSTDRTLEILSDYPCRIIKTKPESYFPGAVLNMAVEASRTETVVFLNSDTVPLSQHCLARLLAALEDRVVQAAYARQIPRPEAAPWVRRDYISSFPDRPTPPPWITLSLPMAAMRKSIWKEHRFYTDAWASEDSEWGHWARRQGYIIRYVPEALVMHSHNYTLRQAYGRRFVEGEADAFIFGQRVTLGKAVGRACRAAVGDLLYQLQHGGRGELLELVQAPVRRACGQWAYYRGHRLGYRRIKQGDSDTTVGQQTVLERHEGWAP